MVKIRKLFSLVIVISLLLPHALFAKDDTEVRKKKKRRITDDKLIEMLDTSLRGLPERLSKIDPKIRRIAFYSLKVDRSNIQLPLFRQIQGKIESAFLKVERPILIYAPEIKPLKIVSKENSISFVSGFQSTDEIREISTNLKLDGFLEGELYLSDKTLYLNLRIFESELMSIAWSEEFSSITPPEPPDLPPKKTTGLDYGIGLSGIPVSKTASSASLTVPSYAKYYSVDMRIAQRTLTSEKLMFTLHGGVLALYEGVSGTSIESTIVSAKGSLGIKFFARIGVRLMLIPVSKEKEARKRRDLLATELTYGRLFGVGSSGINTFGLAFETDITKNISLRGGIRYVPVTEVSITSSSTVNAGGISYEFSILRLNFKP